MKEDFSKTKLRQGCFDLQGYKPKTKLPALNLSKLRSTTPDFKTTITNREIMSLWDKKLETSPLNQSLLPTEQKYNLPTDIISMKNLLENGIIPKSPSDEKIGTQSNRFQLILLEKWLKEMSFKFEKEVETVYLLCLKEALKDITTQCITRSRLILTIFNGVKDILNKKIETLIREKSQIETSKNNEIKKLIEKYEKEIELFKQNTNYYIDKWVASDEKNKIIENENGIYKMIITRFQQEYKIKPIDFNKITELVIEDVADSSKRSQKKIVNAMVPKFNKNQLVQTDETLIVQYRNQESQAFVQMGDNAMQTELETMNAYSQTELIRKRPKPPLVLMRQAGFLIYPKYFSKTQKKLSKQKNRQSITFNLKSLTNDKNFEDFANFSLQTEENRTIKFDTLVHSPKEDEPRVLSACSCKSSSVDSADLKDSKDIKLNKTTENSQFYYKRSNTPHPYQKRTSFSHRKPIFQKFFNPAKEVLNECLRTSSKKLAEDAMLSIRTLQKTISSMYLSSGPKLRKNQFTTFLEHVFSRLSNKYSLKRMRERRLKDLIASSIKYKDLQMPKLFLRMIGAGKCVGLTNYSTHTLKIYLQITHYLTTSTIGVGITEINGKKMCAKSRALECIKDVFSKRLETNDYTKLMIQVENHSKNDSYGMNKDGIVDYEWLLNYLIYNFDYYEKQVLAGVAKVVEAVTFNGFSVCITKAEFLLGLKSIHPDYKKYLDDPLLKKNFKFLNASNNSLVSVNLIERFALLKGLFKAKYVDSFFKSYSQIVNEVSLDKLAYHLDTITSDRLVNSLSKEEWQKKIYMVGSRGNNELSYAIFLKELESLAS